MRSELNFFCDSYKQFLFISRSIKKINISLAIESVHFYLSLSCLSVSGLVLLQSFTYIGFMIGGFCSLLLLDSVLSFFFKQNAMIPMRMARPAILPRTIPMIAPVLMQPSPQSGHSQGGYSEQHRPLLFLSIGVAKIPSRQFYLPQSTDSIPLPTNGQFGGLHLDWRGLRLSIWHQSRTFYWQTALSISLLII